MTSSGKWHFDRAHFDTCENLLRDGFSLETALRVAEIGAANRPLDLSSCEAESPATILIPPAMP
jgi:hypothetical protein